MLAVEKVIGGVVEQGEIQQTLLRAAVQVFQDIMHLPTLIEHHATEASARLLARDVALTVQGALLAQSAPPAVVGAFCDSRLASRHDVFGTLGAGADLDALVARAQLA